MTLPTPDPTDLRRWRRYLADERAEAAIYRELADRRTGEEREIFLALAEAEGRHEAHWLALLGDDIGRLPGANWRTRVLARLARRFGSVFVLALAQQAESRSVYHAERDATAAMAADELTHEEVVRTLAIRGRNRLSGTLRAAVFGANDGLVSNLALIAGIGATKASAAAVLFTGLAGLLAGALSMGAGEYVSVRSQRELLEASLPNPLAIAARAHLDVDANELALVYRARGMGVEDAQARATATLAGLAAQGASTVSATELAVVDPPGREAPEHDKHEVVGTGWNAAISSFCFFAAGATIPVLPYAFGLTGNVAVLVAAFVVGLALLTSGAVVGVLSGASPMRRALRQLAIGYGAAAVTYVLGLAFGVALG